MTKPITGCHNHYYEIVDGEECCIDEKIPFAIPDSWAWIRLGELTNYGTNESIQTKDILADSIIIELEDIEKDSGKIVSYSKKSTNNESIRHIFHRGCVLYSKLRPYLNKVAIPTFDGYCSTEIMVLYPNYEVNLEYLQLVLRSPYFVDYSMSNVYGAKMPRMGTQDGKNALIPLAPLNEQCRIVEFIHRFDFLIEEYRTLSAALISLNNNVKPALSQSIIQSAIQGKLVPQDPNDEPVKIDCKHPIVRRDNSYYQKIGHEEVCIDEQIPFKIPDNWTFVRFSDAVKFKLGKTPPRSTDAYWKDGTIPWISIADMKDMSTTDDTKEKITKKAFEDCFTSFCEKGTLLMSFKLSIGKITIAGMNCVHNEAIISIIPHSNITQEWLMTCLPTISSNVKGEEAIKGNTLNKKTLSDMVIPVPPVKEQQRICHKTNILMQCLKNIDVF